MSGAENVGTNMETLTAEAIAEMLHVVGKTLATFKECAHFSEQEAAHIGEAQRHVDAAVREWTARVMAEVPMHASDDETAIDSEQPAHPERGLDAIIDMLRIYGERVEARDFTTAQRQRLLVAAFNLSIVAQEMTTSVH